MQAAEAMGIVRPPTLKFRISRASESKDGASGSREGGEDPLKIARVSSRKREEDAEAMSLRTNKELQKGINNQCPLNSKEEG